MRDGTIQTIKAEPIQLLPGDFPIPTLHTLLLAPIPPVETLNDVAPDLVEVLATVEPAEVVRPATQYRVQIHDLFLQRAVVSRPSSSRIFCRILFIDTLGLGTHSRTDGYDRVG